MKKITSTNRHCETAKRSWQSLSSNCLRLLHFVSNEGICLLFLLLIPFSLQAAGDKNQKDNSKLPIEISSKTLEVLQNEQKAIFIGDVIAVQGDTRLKSDKMIVHYKQKDDKNAASKPVAATPTPQTQGDMGAITSIDVEGHVLVTNPEETAQGDRGNYDVLTRIIHLFGDNVILTRDKNILRGTALEYNMATGHSVFTNEAGGNTRVRGVFVPKDNK